MDCAPVALSRDLPEGRVMRAQVNGCDIVVWRSHEGALAAWRNRCPHRGMRLSYGFVRGDVLLCPYHGWQFENATGRCRHIPARPDAAPPVAACATAYAITESQGLIWVAVKGAARPVDTGAARLPLRSLTFDCSTSALQTAFSTMSGADFTPVPQCSETLLAFTFNGLPAALALQPLCGKRTNVHALVGAGATAAQAVLLSRWLERLRQMAEAPAEGWAP